MPTDEAIEWATALAEMMPMIVAPLDPEFQIPIALAIYQLIEDALRDEDSEDDSSGAGDPQPPTTAPIQNILAEGDDCTFRYFFSIDKRMFETILVEFDRLAPETAAGIRRRRGRPRAMDNRGMLALALHYISSAAPAKDLVMFFGIIPSTLSKYLRKALRTLCAALKTIKEADVRWPTFDEQLAAAAMVAGRAAHAGHPVPGDLRVLGFVDTTVVRILEPRTNSAFHGFTCVSLVVVFLPDGTITYAITEVPGATVGAAAVRPLCDRVRSSHTLPQMYLVGDERFSARHMADVMLAPLPPAADLEEYTDDQAKFLVDLSKWIRANRGCNDSSSKDVKQTFPRLYSGLSSERAMRSCIFECALRLYNMRVRMLPQTSQMRAVYERELQQRVDDETSRLNDLLAAADRGELPVDDLDDLLEVTKSHRARDASCPVASPGKRSRQQAAATLAEDSPEE